MAQKFKIYRCNSCGNMVMVLKEGQGELVCCGNPMELLSENSTDASQEKHIPVIEKQGKTITVKVGKVSHPMTPEHLIDWIEVWFDNKEVFISFLTPEDKPEVSFETEKDPSYARAYCNLHGLWKS